MLYEVITPLAFDEIKPGATNTPLNPVNAFTIRWSVSVKFTRCLPCESSVTIYSRESANDAPSMAFRITSYNVCYTKLLRIALGNTHNDLIIFHLFFILYV